MKASEIRQLCNRPGSCKDVSGEGFSYFLGIKALKPGVYCALYRVIFASVPWESDFPRRMRTGVKCP
jgi:hypothetical protein